VDARGLWRATLAALAHPSIWGVAVVQLFRLARPGWWRRWPPLPVPDADYLRFRMQTMYGDPAHQPEPDDLVTYLKWCRRFERSVR
jgi:hypothetical protein